MLQGGEEMASYRQGTRDGRPLPLGSSETADELGSPSRTSFRPRARTVARPHRPDRKAGPAGTPSTTPEDTTPMEPNPPQAETFVGIDVAKDKLDVAVGDAPVFTVANTPEGHAALVARLAPLRPRRVVMEATGGLEAAVAAVLCHAGLPVLVVNPR